MSETVFGFLSELPMNWIVFFASAIPITELRAAVPFGIAGGMSPFSAWIWGFSAICCRFPLFSICGR